MNPNTKRTVDAYEGQMFVLTRVGGYERLGEYIVGKSEGDADTTSDGGTNYYYILNEEDAEEFDESFPPKSAESERREETSRMCRSLNDVGSSNDDNSSGELSNNNFLERCKRCAEVDGCGFSPVRDRSRQVDGVGAGGCYATHATATVNDVDECKKLSDEVEEAEKHSVEDWLTRAKGVRSFGTSKWEARFSP